MRAIAGLLSVFLLFGTLLIIHGRFFANAENDYWWAHALFGLLIAWAFAAHALGFKGPQHWLSSSRGQGGG